MDRICSSVASIFGSPNLHSRGRFAVAGCLLMLAVAAPASATSVLFYDDYPYGATAGALAIVGLSGSTVTASNAEDFRIKLAVGGWDLVILGEHGANAFPSASTEVTSYVNGGGRLL